VSTGFICAISGVILGRKRPKYNKTLRATATTPTTSTTVGLLSFCSNLLTYLGTALLWPCRRTKDNANSEAPFGSAVVAARTSQNAQHTNFVECPKGEVRRIPIPRNRVNRPRSAARYPACFRSAQLRMGGLPLPASWRLACLGAPENSLSTEVSCSVVVLDPRPSESDFTCESGYSISAAPCS
jgi:hypothetical protein